MLRVATIGENSSNKSKAFQFVKSFHLSPVSFGREIKQASNKMDEGLRSEYDVIVPQTYCVRFHFDHMSLVWSFPRNHEGILTAMISQKSYNSNL